MLQKHRHVGFREQTGKAALTQIRDTVDSMKSASESIHIKPQHPFWQLQGLSMLPYLQYPFHLCLRSPFRVPFSTENLICGRELSERSFPLRLCWGMPCNKETAYLYICPNRWTTTNGFGFLSFDFPFNLQQPKPTQKWVPVPSTKRTLFGCPSPTCPV